MIHGCFVLVDECCGSLVVVRLSMSSMVHWNCCHRWWLRCKKFVHASRCGSFLFFTCAL